MPQANCSVILPSLTPDPHATVDAVFAQGGTVMLADTHTLKALEGMEAPGSLRTGLVKVGSGEALGLKPPVAWSGVSFTAVGK